MWTEDRELTLTREWNNGLSATQIAAVLGGIFSRSAILGKAHRLGRCNGSRRHLTNNRHQKPRNGAPRAPRVREPHFGARPPAAAARAEPATNLGDPPPEERIHSLLLLKPNQCRWPIGEPGKPGFAFCGRHVEGIGPSCPTHCERARAPGK